MMLDKGTAGRCVLAAFWLFAAAPALGNDSSATLGAGGLVLTRSAEIALDSEDLFIGADEVRVRYAFRNTTAQDVETIVAFPLPDIDLNQLYEVPVNVPGSDPVNFVDFQVTADGRPVQPSVDARAFLDGKEVTAALARHRVPLTFFDPAFDATLQALDAAARQDLAAQGLAEFDPYGGVIPHWLVRTTFYWTQRFPAGHAVTIEHRYRPVVGQSFFSAELLGDKEWRDGYCIDAATERAIRAQLADSARQGGGDAGYLVANTIEYILTTAGNWRGPIGRFRLTLDKGSEDHLMSLCLMSLCIDGIRKAGPTRFVAEATDFVPRRDLRILLLQEMGPE